MAYGPRSPSPPMAHGRRAATRRRDELQPAFVTMLAVGSICALFISLGWGNLLIGTAPWAHVNVTATVSGVFGYDPGTGETGAPSTQFRTGHAFAASVDWSRLPGSLQVGARWYDGNDQDWGGTSPAPARALAAQRALAPMARTNAPAGRYELLVMRYFGGHAIQILGHAIVQVRGG
ncbi:MAG: hypothetical protein WAM30_04365 [Candidatus Dormiibacterota bacterium]